MSILYFQNMDDSDAFYAGLYRWQKISGLRQYGTVDPRFTGTSYIEGSWLILKASDNNLTHEETGSVFSHEITVFYTDVEYKLGFAVYITEEGGFERC